MREGRKPGRNSSCPCGSGKKYKRCHGGPDFDQRNTKGDVPVEVEHQLALRLAQEQQRERLEGLGRPIISAEFKGYRLVAAGKRLFYSKSWKTFHDFLLHYIKKTLGSDWGNAELLKPLPEQHPVMRWFHHVTQMQQRDVKQPGVVHTSRPTAAAAAYLRLAHDLFTLEHNVAVQERLIARLKDRAQFAGAHYEIFVAASFIRAGFDIAFENEADRTTTHCEFTATHRDTAFRYSVEAKHRESGDGKDGATGNFRIGRRLARSFRKKADHARIVFLDVSFPHTSDEGALRTAFERVLSFVRRFETQSLNGQATPSAYVVLTSHPHEYESDSVDFANAVAAEGFKIPDFRHDASFSSVRAAVESRDRHRPLFELLRSIGQHSHVPATFDGSVPEFAFGQQQPRLTLGKTYMVPDEAGRETPGVLTNAIVQEGRKLATGVYRLRDGRSIIANTPLTDAELRAYKRSPETFFGVIQHVTKTIQEGDAIGWYDFFYNGYKDSPKETLLNLLKDSPEIEFLRTLPQPEILKALAEGYANHMLQQESGK